MDRPRDADALSVVFRVDSASFQYRGGFLDEGCRAKGDFG